MHAISVELKIEFVSRWHMGSGEGSPAASRIVERDGLGRPYIPGSTLKGVVRESCERLSRALGYPEPADPHTSVIASASDFVPLAKVGSPVDALFGTRFEGGELFFRDAYELAGGMPPPAQVISRTAMYRGLRTARTKHLFSTEYVSRGAFVTAIDGRHRQLVTASDEAVPFAYSVMIAGILNVDRVGGDKSTGAGAINMRVTKLSYNGRPIEPLSVLESLGDPDVVELYRLYRADQQKEET